MLETERRSNHLPAKQKKSFHDFLNTRLNGIKVLLKKIQVDFWTIYALAFFVMCLSIVSELFFHSSLSQTLCTLLCCDAFRQAMYNVVVPNINYVVIDKTIDMIGLVSVLITWTYHELDSKVLGQSCRVLLDRVCKHYHLLVMLHVISVVICAWATRNGQLELSCLALFVVVLGTIMHWIVMYQLTLSPSKRQKHAVTQYEEEIQLLENEAMDSFFDVDMTNCILSKLLQMANQINIETVQNKDFIGCFTRLLYLLAKNTDHAEKLFPYLTEVWAQIRAGKDDNEWEVVFRNLGSQIQDYQIKQEYTKLKSMTMIFLAYFILMWQNTAIVEAEAGASAHKAYETLLAHVLYTENILQEKDAINSTLLGAYVIMSWLAFRKGYLTDYERITKLSNSLSDSAKLSINYCYIVYWGLALRLFREKVDTTDFEEAFEMIRNPIPSA